MSLNYLSVSLIYLSVSLFNDVVNVKTAKPTLHAAGPPACGTGDFGHGGTRARPQLTTACEECEPGAGKGRFGDLPHYLALIFSFVI